MTRPFPVTDGANPSAGTAAGSSMGSRRDTERLLGLGEAAAALGVHYMTAYRYVRTGLLPAHQTAGQWRIEPAAVEEMAASRLGRTTSDDPRVPTADATVRDTTRRPVFLADRLLAGDEPGAWRIVDDAVASGWELDELYVGLLAGSLREVGDRWAAGRASVAEEHRASVVAMRIIGRLGPRSFRPGRPRGTVVIGAAPGDRHSLPSALLADLLRAQGLRVVDLGADTPPEHLAAAAADEDRLLAVGICATTPLDPGTGAQLRHAVTLVQEVARVPVLVGGPAVHPLDGPVHRTGADGHSATASEALAWFGAVADASRRTAGSAS